MATIVSQEVTDSRYCVADIAYGANQTFALTDGDEVTSVSLYLKRISPVDTTNLTILLRKSLTVLDTVVVSIDGWNTSSPEWHEFALTSSITTTGTYNVYIIGTGGVHWYSNTTNPYSGGRLYGNDEGGGGHPVTELWDACFKTNGTSLLEKATDPTPTDSATNVSLNTNTLSWVAGVGAVKHNVYLSWWGGVSTLYTTGTSITLSDWVPLYADRFGYDETYTWRVDEVDDEDNVVTGDTWSFTTRSFDQVWPTARMRSDDSIAVPPFDIDTMYWTGENFLTGGTFRLIAASGDAIWYEGTDT